LVFAFAIYTVGSLIELVFSFSYKILLKDFLQE
jgi:hypothetical protein